MSLRVLAIVAGGYLASAGLVQAAAVGLPVARLLSRADAVVLASSLGFLVYLVLALWIAAERVLWKACLVPIALAGLGFGLAAALGRYA